MPCPQGPVASPEPARRLALKISATIACRITLNTARRFIYPFAPDLGRALNVPLTTITGLIAVNWATTVLGIGFGPMADRFGYRGMMLIGMAALTAGMLTAGLLPFFTVLVIAQILGGLGKSIYDPAVQAYISERVPYRRRGLVIGLMETAWAGSTLVGIPLVALLIERTGWRAAFFALSASGFLGMILTMALVPGEGKPAAPPRDRLDARSILGTIARSRPALGMVAFGFLFNAAMDNLFVIYGAWFEDAFQLSVLALGVSTSVIGGAELAGEFITAGLGDRLGLKRMAIGGVALCVLTYGLLPVVARTVTLALAGLFVHFCIFEMTIVTVVSITTELLPASRATMIAAYYAATGAGRVAGALLGGPVWQTAGIAGTGMTSAVITVLALTALACGLRGWKQR